VTADFDSVESMRVLYEISTIIQSDLKLGEKFKKALAKICGVVHCNSASLFIYHEDTGKLEEVATIGERVDLIESIDFDMGKGFSAWVAKQRRSVLIPNLRRKRPGGCRSFISTPLISEEKLIGVMNLGGDSPNAFTERHMEFLEIIASQFAHAVERSKYEQRLLEKNAALEKAHEEIKSQQKKIIEMEKYQVLGQMAVSINHEINNPLTTIIGNVELLLMMYPDLDESVRKKLAVINEEARRIADIVDKVRNMKRVVTEEYIDKFDEKMIDIHSSYEPEKGDGENLS